MRVKDNKPRAHYDEHRIGTPPTLAPKFGLKILIATIVSLLSLSRHTGLADSGNIAPLGCPSPKARSGGNKRSFSGCKLPTADAPVQVKLAVGIAPSTRCARFHPRTRVNGRLSAKSYVRFPDPKWKPHAVLGFHANKRACALRWEAETYLTRRRSLPVSPYLTPCRWSFADRADLDRPHHHPFLRLPCRRTKLSRPVRLS
jgi:hypothetical protein